MTDPDMAAFTVVLDADAQPLKRELDNVARLGKTFGDTLSRAFVGLALEGKGLTDVIRGIGLQLSKLAIDAAMKPVGQAFADILAGAGQGFAAGSGLGFAKGGVLPEGTPVPFASGGVVASPVTFPLGRGLGLAGERGSEAIMPLARGPDGRLGVAASGFGGGVHVTFNVSTPDAESFRRSETQLAAMLARVVGRGNRNM